MRWFPSGPWKTPFAIGHGHICAGDGGRWNIRCCSKTRKYRDGTPKRGLTKSCARQIRASSGTSPLSDLFEQPDNATPLTPEEMRDLIPTYIAYRSELN